METRPEPLGRGNRKWTQAPQPCWHWAPRGQHRQPGPTVSQVPPLMPPNTAWLHSAPTSVDARPGCPPSSTAVPGCPATGTSPGGQAPGEPSPGARILSRSTPSICREPQSRAQTGREGAHLWAGLGTRGPGEAAATSPPWPTGTRPGTDGGTHSQLSPSCYQQPFPPRSASPLPGLGPPTLGARCPLPKNSSGGELPALGACQPRDPEPQAGCQGLRAQLPPLHPSHCEVHFTGGSRGLNPSQRAPYRQRGPRNFLLRGSKPPLTAGALAQWRALA